MSAAKVDLVTGPYRAGKSLGLLDQLVDYLSLAPLVSRPAILTVPSHRYKRLVEKRLAQVVKERGAALPGLFGLKIFPFYELCHFVLRQAGQSFRILPDALRPAILEKAIGEVHAAGRLVNLADVAHFKGTHAGILELIDELERAGYAPSEVLSILSKKAASNSRYMELARIYEAYWLELERLDIYDERKLAYKTREILNKLDASSLPIGFLGVDGFDRFNRLQLQVLSALSEQANRTIICFDYIYPAGETGAGENPNGHGPFAAGNNFRQAAPDYRWKEKSIRELDEVIGPHLQKMEFAPVDELLALPQPAISTWRSLDRMLEMDEVVRRLKFALDGGLSPDEVIVVVRSVAPYLTAIHAAFEKAQIPYFLDEAIGLTSVPLVKYLLRLLTLHSSDFARQDVVRALKSPFCNLDYLDLSGQAVETIDNQSLRQLVVESREDWAKLGAVAQQLPKFFDRLTPPAGHLSLTQFVTWVEDIIDDLLILPNDEEYADPLVIWEEHQALYEFRKVLSTLILEENLVGVDYDGRANDYETTFARLEKALKKANFRRPGGGQKSVTVCGADLVPNRKFKAIFLAGLVEGEFPRRNERTGFLSRDEVFQWKTYDIDIENPRSDESFEISLYKSLLERATDHLYLSSPRYEMDSEELVPSFFLSQGDDKVLAGIPVLAPNVNALLNPVSPLDLANGILWCRGSAYSQDMDKYPVAVGALFDQLSESLNVVEARAGDKESAVVREWNGDISEQVRLGLASVNLPAMWSVSRLNDYGKCPFRFWVSNVLKIQKIVEPEAGLDAQLLGKLYHKALELFYSRLKELGLTVLSEDQILVQSTYEKSIADAIVWLETEEKFKAGDFWEYDKQEIYFRLRRFLAMEQRRAEKGDGDYVPQLFEQGFGMKSEANSAGALAVKVGDCEVKIRGVIDRVDQSSTGKYRVIDYKSGATRIGKDEALDGRNMQLPIYAMALNRAIAPGATVAGGSFFSISSGEPIGSIDLEKTEEDIIGTVEQNIIAFVSAAQAGNFNVRPSDPKVCSTCDHLQVCRITELRKTGILGDGRDAAEGFD